MARPTTKTDLLRMAEENYAALMDLVNSFSDAEREGTFPFEDRDRNVRDVLAHLYEWQVMMEIWYTDGMAGKTPVTPAPGYTWKTTPELNQVIWQKYQDTTLAEIEKMLAASHKKMLTMIEKHTNEELFARKQYGWTKTTTLGAYFVSATSSHYDWAIKKLKKYKRSLK